MVVGASLRDRSGDKQGRLGDLLEGEGTMSTFASILLTAARRPVLDKTGLTGSYRVKMNFDMGFALRQATTNEPTDGAASVFTAIQEQLGLKLESSKEQIDTLTIDHIERPTEN